MSSSKQYQLVDTTISHYHNQLCRTDYSLPIVEQLSSLGMSIIDLGELDWYLGTPLSKDDLFRKFPDQQFAIRVDLDIDHVRKALNINVQHIVIHIDAEQSNNFCNHTQSWDTIASAILLVRQANRQLHCVFDVDVLMHPNLPKAIAIHAQRLAIPVLGIQLINPIIHPDAVGHVINTIRSNYDGIIRFRSNNEANLALAYVISSLDAGAQMIDVCLGDDYPFACDYKSVAGIMASLYDQDDALVIDASIICHIKKMLSKSTNSPRKIPAILSPEGNAESDSMRVEINNLVPECSSHLPFHGIGPGVRWLLTDKSLDDRSPFYVVERRFDTDNSMQASAHVGLHAHSKPSLKVFMGHNLDGTGLTVKVVMRDETGTLVTKVVHSPASVLVPAYCDNFYEYVSGKGHYIFVLLSPGYTDDLLNFNE